MAETPGTGTALIELSVKGAREAGQQLSRMGRRVQPVFTAEFRGELKDEAEEAMKDVAPVDTGLLQELIEGRVSGGGGRIRLIIHSPVRDPENNYAYTGVTRLGHKKARIYPRHKGVPEPFAPGSKTIAGDPKSKFFIDKGHAPALAVHLSGRYGAVSYLASVRGYKPSHDWVIEGIPAAESAAAEAANRIGRRITIGVR